MSVYQYFPSDYHKQIAKIKNSYIQNVDLNLSGSDLFNYLTIANPKLLKQFHLEQQQISNMLIELTKPTFDLNIKEIALSLTFSNELTHRQIKLLSSFATKDFIESALLQFDQSTSLTSVNNSGDGIKETEDFYKIANKIDWDYLLNSTPIDNSKEAGRGNKPLLNKDIKVQHELTKAHLLSFRLSKMLSSFWEFSKNTKDDIENTLFWIGLIYWILKWTF